MARRDMSPTAPDCVHLGAPLQLVLRTDGYFLIQCAGEGL